MTRRLISSGSKFEQDVGYSRAVIDEEWVFVISAGLLDPRMQIEIEVTARMRTG